MQTPENKALSRGALENQHVFLLKSQYGKVRLPRHVGSPYVFYDQEGKPYKRIVKGFRQACKRAGINDFRFHDLRHTFASHLVMGGVPLRTVQELLGHKTGQMTLRYTHLSTPHLQEAVSVLDTVLAPVQAEKMEGLQT